MGFSHHFLLIRLHEMPIYSVTNATRAINLIKVSCLSNTVVMQYC